MNRELKFRVWDKELKTYNTQCVHHLEKQDGVMSIKLNLDIVKVCGIDRFVIETWTGCKDKNGTPIYEGDILANDLILPHDNDNIGVVYFAAGTFMIDGDGPFFDHVYGHSPDILDNHSVIGNKFENPELLKV
jgi:uncharacterized phage protein (TIGR01671 family)